MRTTSPLDRQRLVFGMIFACTPVFFHKLTQGPELSFFAQTLCRVLSGSSKDGRIVKTVIVL